MTRYLAPLFFITFIACGDDAPVQTLNSARPDASSSGSDMASDLGSGDGDVGVETPDMGADLAVGPVDELVAANPPTRPLPPARAQHITVTVKTSTATNAETDDPAGVCVGDGICWSMNIPDVNDRESGETEVYHYQGEDIDRASIDRMTVRSLSDPAANNDRWSPECIDVRIDGVPVYCNANIPVHIGTGSSADEVVSWTDPAGLAESCTSCWGSMLTHGPLIGPPTSEKLRVWVRTDATRLTGLRLGHTADLDGAPIVAWVWPLPEDDFTADLEVGGLKPNTTYYYRVEVDGDTTEPVRAIRTAPADNDASPMRFVIGSCTRDQEQPLFQRVLDTRPDAFLFVGDTNYANTHYREALRWHYRRFRALPERADFVANTPTYTIWDDHEFLANNSNGTCLDRDKALKAFSEYWGNPEYGVPEAPGTYFHSRWGAVDFFMLDCRMYRPDVGDPQKRCEPDPNPPNLPRSDGPLGPVQEAWLMDRLEASDATFKVVACGSRFTPEGSLDSWAAFPAASQRLWQGIADRNVDGVVFVSGDIHRSLFTAVDAPAYSIPELVSSPMANSNSNCGSSDPEQRECYDEGNSWIQVDVDPTVEDPTLEATILDETGTPRATWLIRRSELE